VNTAIDIDNLTVHMHMSVAGDITNKLTAKDSISIGI